MPFQIQKLNKPYRNLPYPSLFSLYQKMSTRNKPNQYSSSSSSCNSIYVNKLTTDNNKENEIFNGDNKQNTESLVPTNGTPNKRTPLVQKSLSTNGSFSLPKEPSSNFKSLSTGRVFKASSLQFCMQMDEPDKKAFGSAESGNSSSLKIWDFSDSEAAPASSWSTLPNRALPVDIGRCTCVILKEALPKGFYGGTLYALYTSEGHGRQDRKLAVAYYRRRNGKSEYVVAQNTKGIICSSSDGTRMGTLTSNLMGSKYYVSDQANSKNSTMQQTKPLALIEFTPTIATWAGSHRNIRVYIPKHEPMQLKNTTQIQAVSSLATEKVHKLFSRIPEYNNVSKQYELDFRDRGRAGLKIQKSAKNFQLTLGNERRTILQLGRVDRKKFVMDFRYPLTGYQAFCICLASIDSKPCCTL